MQRRKADGIEFKLWRNLDISKEKVSNDRLKLIVPAATATMNKSIGIKFRILLTEDNLKFKIPTE